MASRSKGKGGPSREERAPRLVRKRDGRTVPFERIKIERAVASAMSAAGEEDGEFAKDVARVVELACERDAELALRGVSKRRRGGEASEPEAPIPDIESIQDKVEQALIGMGRGAVAKAYILYRDKRARVRRTLESGGEGMGAGSVREAATASESSGAGPTVREAERTGAWSRARIAAALVAEADLPHEVSEEIASRVERRVLSSGLEHISTALIRALVDNELVELGLTSALARTEPVAIPRHDLGRVLAGEGAAAFEPWLRPGEMRPARTDAAETDARAPGGPFEDAGLPEHERRDPTGLERVLSGEVLRRYALGEALDPGSAERHLAGDLHVEDLHHPHLPLTLALPAELLLTAPGAGEAGAGDAAFALLEALPATLRRTSRGVALEELGPLLSELVRSTRSGSPLGLGAWLRALSGLASAASRTVDLISPGNRYAAARGRLIEALVRQPHAVWAPRLLLDEAEGTELLESASSGDAKLLDAAIARGRIVVCWSGDEQRFAGPGLRRRARERGLVACGGAIALNLPRLAREACARAPRGAREDVVLEGLYTLVGQAAGAATALHRFQSACARARPGAPLEARTAFAVTPVGLGEALARLGDGEADPEQGARLLGLLSEACQRLADPVGPGLVPTFFFGDRARLRLAWLEADARGRTALRQPMLFGGLVPSEEDLAVRAFSEGLSGLAGPGWRRGEAEAAAVRTLACGALWPPPAAHAGRFLDARAGRAGRPGHVLLPLESPTGGALDEPARLRLVRGERSLETSSAGPDPTP